eukprot:26689-Prymnesium_polylepis.1
MRQGAQQTAHMTHIHNSERLGDTTGVSRCAPRHTRQLSEAAVCAAAEMAVVGSGDGGGGEGDYGAVSCARPHVRGRVCVRGRLVLDTYQVKWGSQT